MKKINGNKQMNNVWEFRAERNPFRHMAVKNSGIVEKALLASTNEGDIVLDPFAGSGTTGYVAKALKRNCIQIEKSNTSIAIIIDRLKGRYGNYAPQYYDGNN